MTAEEAGGWCIMFVFVIVIVFVFVFLNEYNMRRVNDS